MGTVLLFVTLASLAVVVWAVIDVARRPAVALAGKWKALWITGMVSAWFLFGAIGATAMTKAAGLNHIPQGGTLYTFRIGDSTPDSPTQASTGASAGN